MTIKTVRTNFPKSLKLLPCSVWLSTLNGPSFLYYFSILAILTETVHELKNATKNFQNHLKELDKRE